VAVEIIMTTRLNWRPDGGIVAFVPEDTLPEYYLPPEATRIQLNGKPAFHVTLIAKRVMEPYKEEMKTLWPAITDAAPEPPVAQLSLELKKAFDEKKQKTSWYVDVINADSYSEYLRVLVDLIRSHFQTAGYGPFINPEMDRLFHLTVANDKGGNPMDSVSDLPRHS
jgi:hypothetical protein